MKKQSQSLRFEEDGPINCHGIRGDSPHNLNRHSPLGRRPTLAKILRVRSRCHKTQAAGEIPAACDADYFNTKIRLSWGPYELS
jgi:hypothetical protein